MFDSYNPAVLNEAIQKGAAGGGGGTTVVANPEGAATADLTKLGVGDTIYGIPSTADFSTSEVDTGAKWVDNKAIYRKVILLENVTIGSDAYSVDISGLSADMIIGINGIFTENSSEYFNICRYSVNGAKTAISIERLVTTLTVIGNHYIIVEYTKTASEAKKSTKKK